MFSIAHKKDKGHDGNERSANVSHLRAISYWLNEESPYWIYRITVHPDSIYNNIKWYRKHPWLLKYEALSKLYRICKSEKLRKKIKEYADKEYPKVEE